jgi:hypothetical protein
MAKQSSAITEKSKANSAPAGKKFSREREPIDEFELDLPAGFTADGARMATLREILDPAVPTRSMLQLSEDHWFDLAAKRVQLRPSGFSLQIPLHGRIGKDRAVAEIRGRTRMGLHFAEIEKTIVTQSLRRWSNAH